MPSFYFHFASWRMLVTVIPSCLCFCSFGEVTYVVQVSKRSAESRDRISAPDRTLGRSFHILPWLVPVLWRAGDQLELGAPFGVATRPVGILGRKIADLFLVDVPPKPTTSSSPSEALWFVWCKFTQPERMEKWSEKWKSRRTSCPFLHHAVSVLSLFPVRFIAGPLRALMLLERAERERTKQPYVFSTPI